MPSVMEKEEAFERKLEYAQITANSTADIEPEVMDCSYTLTSSSGISVKAEIRISGNLYTSSGIEAITDNNYNDTTQIVRDGD